MQDEYCPSCRAQYDGGKKRKLIDSCGHPRCFSCMYAMDSCPLCPTAPKTQDSSLAANGSTAYKNSIYPPQPVCGSNMKHTNSPSRAASFNNGSHYATSHHSVAVNGKDSRVASDHTDHYKGSPVHRSASYRVASPAQSRHRGQGELGHYLHLL